MGQAAPEPARRRRRLIGWSVLGLLVVGVAAGVWLVERVLLVRSELASVAALRSDVVDALGQGGLSGLDETVAEFDAHASRAAEATEAPVWRVAEWVPFVGPNLSAVRTVSESLDRLSDEVATPLASLAGGLAVRGLLDDGAVDVDFLAAAHAPVVEAAAALADTERRLVDVKRSQLIGEVADGVTDLEQLVTTLSDAVDGLAGVTAVLPRMLGSDEPRSILVMLQNNAELRSGGGITGSFAEIEARDGVLRLARQADSSDFGGLEPPDVAVPAATSALYGDIVGLFVHNATTTPDFALSAELASGWWARLTGRAPDVVVAIDPLVLRALLDVTGPIDVGRGLTLRHERFVREVLVDPYFTLDSREQTRYFQRLTKRYFEAVLTSTAPPEAWITALQAPIEQGRISVWSSHEDEAALLAGSAFGGPLARHNAAGEGAFAVYLNDTTGAKMDSALEVKLGSAVGTCRADEQPQVAVRVRLTNTAPADAGTAWPASMTGDGHWGVPPGQIGTAVAVSAPKGWFFGGTTVDGDRVATIDVADAGVPTSAVEVTLEPGESADVEMRFVAPTRDAVEPTLLHTPLLRAPETTALTSLSCE